MSSDLTQNSPRYNVPSSKYMNSGKKIVSHLLTDQCLSNSTPGFKSLLEIAHIRKKRYLVEERGRRGGKKHGMKVKYQITI